MGRAGRVLVSRYSGSFRLLVSKLLFKQDRGKPRLVLRPKWRQVYSGLVQNAASLRVIDLLEDGASIQVPHTRHSFSPVGFVFFEVRMRSSLTNAAAGFKGCRLPRGSWGRSTWTGSAFAAC